MGYDLIIYTPMYITAFWAIVLFASAKAKNWPQKFLGIFMILALGVYFSHALYFKNLYTIYLLFHPVYVFTSLSVYPMYYWYIRLLTVESDIRRKNLFMFLPAIILAVFSAAIFYLMSPAERIDYIHVHLFQTSERGEQTTLLGMQTIIFVVSRAIFTIQIFLYLVLGRKLVLKYNKRISNFYSNTENRNLDWVNLFLYSFFVTSLMSIIFNLIGRPVFNNSQALLLIPSGIFSVLLFLIGFQGYMQNCLVIEMSEDEKHPSELSMKEYNQAMLKEKLLILFGQENIYKQNDLKITQVALRLQTNRTYVSNLINTEFKCTFSEFVNQYRIQEAKKLLDYSKQQNYTLDFIADAAGFGSVNSFIRIFKEMEGTTPGKYREKLILR